MMRRAGAAVVLIFAVPAVALAGTLRVPSEHATIQSGIDAASPGDTVFVAPGTYSDVTVRVRGGLAWAAVVFLEPDVKVVSEGGASVTTLDMLGSVAGQGRNVVSGVGQIEGFTITGVAFGHTGMGSGGGGHVVVKGCVFRDLDSGPTTVGGLAIGDDTFAEILDCRFERCRGHGAGAVWVDEAPFVIRGCTFEDCEGTAVQGFGELPSSYSALIEDSVFLRNRDPDGNGGGLAVSQYGGGCTVRRCVFVENEARSGGGGATIGNSGPILVEGCVFRSNRSLESWAGGLHVGVADVRGCTFSGNSSLTSGGAVVVQGGPSVFSNNVIASTTGTVALRGPSSAALTAGCNVFWNNAAGDAQNYVFAATDRILDPLFCDEPAGDLTLQPLSPCLPDFSGGCGRVGALEQGCGTVSIEAESWGKVKAAYRAPHGGQ